MSTRSRNLLQEWFKRGKYPRQEQFWDWMDSFWHKEEDHLPIDAVEDLPEQLNNKYSVARGEELERRMDNAEDRLDGHDQKIDKIEDWLIEHDDRLDGHDADIKRIDEKDVEQDDRLSGHDADIKRIDEKDVEQDGRLHSLDSDIERIDNKDTEQDGRLDGHDSDVVRIDIKLGEHDTHLGDLDFQLDRCDYSLEELRSKVGIYWDKIQQHDGRLDDHDTDIKRIDNSIKNHSERLGYVEGRIEGIEDGMGEYDSSFTYHWEEIRKQGSRLDEQDTKLSAIDDKDREQDQKLTNYDTRITANRQDIDSLKNNSATSDTSGLMSAEDKEKLDNIDPGANKYVHPTEHPAAMIKFTDGKTFQEKLNDGSLKGDTGAAGSQGPKGDTGAAGKSAYQGYTESGGTLSEAEFNTLLASLELFVRKDQTPQFGIFHTFSSLENISLGTVYDLRYTHTNNAVSNLTLGLSGGTDGMEWNIAVINNSTSILTLRMPTANGYQSDEDSVLISTAHISEINIKRIGNTYVIKTD